MILLRRPIASSEIAHFSHDFDDLRQRVEIAVIDDEPFPQAANLRAVGFRLTEIGDPTVLRAVEPYSVVICDIKGVGKTLRDPSEGGALIQEIRRAYPAKYLIAYSGASFDPSFNRFFGQCDAALTKDSDFEKWSGALGDAITETHDPIRYWQRWRRRLVARGVETVEIFRLEQVYFRSFKQGKVRPLERLAQSHKSDHADLFRAAEDLLHLASTVLHVAVLTH
jgi:hypothetical protein